MTALLQETRIGTSARDRFVVEREEICFYNRSPQHVHIEITMRNDGVEVSAPTRALISAAPLGAFVTWRPLALLSVPALEPGETHVLRLDAERRIPRRLGTPGRIPPRDVLTALAQDDEYPNPPPQDTRGCPHASTLPFTSTSFRGNIHWAGNLNIFIGARASSGISPGPRVYPARPISPSSSSAHAPCPCVPACWHRHGGDTARLSPKELSGTVSCRRRRRDR